MDYNTIFLAILSILFATGTVSAIALPQFDTATTQTDSALTQTETYRPCRVCEELPPAWVAIRTYTSSGTAIAAMPVTTPEIIQPEPEYRQT